MSPPSGEGWQAEIVWELRLADGTVHAWTNTPSLVADSSSAVSVSRSPSLPIGAAGLLVGRVTLSSARGVRVVGLEGRTVEVTGSGLVSSELPYTGAVWVGDPQKALDFDARHEDAEVQ